MKQIIYLCFLILLVGCNGFGQATIEENQKNGLNIPSEILTKIQKSAKTSIVAYEEEIWTYDKNDHEVTHVLKGVYFPKISEGRANIIFKSHIEEVKKSGHYLFLTNMSFNKDFTETFYDIVIIKAKDQFEVIKLIGTNAVNYDLYNTEIIEQLKAWHAEVDFSIDVVDQSRIHAYMGKQPKDLKTFTNEIYKFCPDVIDQGYGDMEEMILDYEQNGYFWLWWD